MVEFGVLGGSSRLMKSTLFILLLLTARFVLAAEIPPYEGYEQDCALLRDTYQLTNPPLKASSGKATTAAHRIFNKVTFIGLTRERVLAILGDPKTISDYGVAPTAAPDSPLDYRFDTGFGGWDYLVEFRNGIVITVKENSLE